MQKQKEIYIRSLYLTGEGTTELITKCKSIMQREQWSFNQLVKEALKEYEVRHGLGNNSFTLDKFGITWTKAQLVDKCIYKNCEKLATATAVYIPAKQTVGLCDAHSSLAKANPKVFSDLRRVEK